MLGRIKNQFRRQDTSESLPNTNNTPGKGANYHDKSIVDRHTIYHAKLTDLASFDACVEASDALAATTYPNEEDLKDCSVIVSPDGDLLLIKPSNENTNDQKDIDYDSTIVIGNDLNLSSETNGFSALGWSAAAASLAIRQTEQTLRHTEIFLSQVHQTSVEAQKKHLISCQLLRTALRIGEYPSVSQNFPPLPLPKELRNKSNQRSLSADFNSLADLESNQSSWNTTRSAKENGRNSRESTLEMGPHRVGPLLYSGSSLFAAMIELETYYTKLPVPRPTSLQYLIERADQTAERAFHRETTLKDMQRRVNDAEERLRLTKEHAHQRWAMVHQAEELVSKLVEERMLIRSRARERQRVEALEAENRNHQQHAVPFATDAEIWEIVAAATAKMEEGDFTPLDLPSAPVTGLTDKSEHAEQSNVGQDLLSVNIPLASRVEIEQECCLPALRSAALAADTAVEDAAQNLLNVLSMSDTTRRSARVSAETSLLAACNAQAESLRRIVKLERAAMQERLARLEQLEQVISAVDIRQDLERYIALDKKERGGSTWMGEYDDGGIASALAILSSHVEGSTGRGPGSPNKNQPWLEEQDEETSPEVLEDAVVEVFDTEVTEDSRESFANTVKILCDVASNRNAPKSKRSVICFALNAQRSNAEIRSKENFDALCQIFWSILSGCDHEAGGVSNAKMCMMLSQTFYIMDLSESNTFDTAKREIPSPQTERDKRIYVKSKLIGHPLWDENEFWDQALHQCVTESLTHSGVMANFERTPSRDIVKKSEWMETKKLQWHDLTHAERAEAASQVHAIVFAQLGALAHSMIEFGCGMNRSCAFVRRMSVRNQLPISQRTMLLQHLVRSKSSEDIKNEAEEG
jgi:hypothetical protein